MKEYEILEIYREVVRKGTYDFKLFLFDGENVVAKKASDEMKGMLKKGRFYKEDWICIEKEDDGVVFSLIEPKPYSYSYVTGREFNYEAYLVIRKNGVKTESERPSKRHRKVPNSNPEKVGSSIETEDMYICDEAEKKFCGILLPFLNDTPPYSPLKLPTVKARPIYSSSGLFDGRYLADSCEYVTVDEWYDRGCPMVPVMGRVGYKTRMASISCSRKYPYYFLILLTSQSNFLKAVVWGEDLPYSCMKVGDVIGLHAYRKKVPIEGVSVVEHNRFTEAVYFQCKEVSAKELFGIELERNGEMPRSIFSEVSGEVEYLSVLNRRYSGSLEEYYLVRIGCFKVLLFYNSAKEFYRIEAGKYLKITNLRTEVRGKFTFYVSTIYTQIEIQGGKPQSRVSKASERNVVTNSDESSVNDSKPNVGEATYYDAINFQSSSEEEKDSSDIDEVLLMDDKGGNIDSELLKGISSMDSEDSMITIEPSPIFGAIGYIPDDFSTVEEMFLKTKETIHEREYELGLFMAPLEIPLGDLQVEVEKMVLNESKKFLVEGTLIDVDFSNFMFSEPTTLNDGTTVNYSRNGLQVLQSPAYIKISHTVDLVICLFNNFWTGDRNLDSLYALGGCSSLEEFKDLIGRRMKFVIDAFRASEDTVLLCLTKTFR